MTFMKYSRLWWMSLMTYVALCCLLLMTYVALCCLSLMTYVPLWSVSILPLPKLTTFFKLQFFQRFAQGFIPVALSTIWIRNRDRIHTGGPNLRNSEDIFVPVSSLTQFENFPLYSIPKTWVNFENEHVKILRDKNEFNFKLKAALLSELNENYTCNRLICPFCTLNS